MVLYGIRWYCMVLYGIVWYWMVLDGNGWYWMVLDGIGWYWMVLGCFRLPQNGIEHSELYVGGLGMGWDWDGSPGGRRYRAPYGANNIVI